ncbi:transcription initiation factor TFIID subunit A-domain-containing protein [Globomyces pollinis-pini]|nr:transcription initiation factor TFIID subunit A-domain-containing protein [Globomyces pollinis-pini]
MFQQQARNFNLQNLNPVQRSQIQRQLNLNQLYAQTQLNNQQKRNQQIIGSPLYSNPGTPQHTQLTQSPKVLANQIRPHLQNIAPQQNNAFFNNSVRPPNQQLLMQLAAQNSLTFNIAKNPMNVNNMRPQLNNMPAFTMPNGANNFTAPNNAMGFAGVTAANIQGFNGASPNTNGFSLANHVNGDSSTMKANTPKTPNALNGNTINHHILANQMKNNMIRPLGMNTHPNSMAMNPNLPNQLNGSHMPMTNQMTNGQPRPNGQLFSRAPQQSQKCFQSQKLHGLVEQHTAFSGYPNSLQQGQKMDQTSSLFTNREPIPQSTPVTGTNLSKRKLHFLLAELDPRETLEPDTEDSLLKFADHFIENVAYRACKIAKHCGSKTVRVRDIQLELEQNWNINIPGFQLETLNKIKKITPSSTHTTKLAAISKQKKEESQAVLNKYIVKERNATELLSSVELKESPELAVDIEKDIVENGTGGTDESAQECSVIGDSVESISSNGGN